MAMAACLSSSSATLAQMGLELHARPMMSRRRRPDQLCVYSSAILWGNGVPRRFRGRRHSVTARAVVAGDGEEVEDTERPQTASSKTRPKTVSSTVQRPAVLSSSRRERAASEPKDKVRSSNLISSVVDEIAGFMAPREKGDIRDVVLMSFSFALFIYISQHLVHAYCVFRHTLQPFHRF